MAGYKIATGFVDIEVRYDERKLRKQAERAGEQTGGRFTKGFNKKTSEYFRNLLSTRDRQRLRRSFRDLGEDSGSSFSRAFNKNFLKDLDKDFKSLFKDLDKSVSRAFQLRRTRRSLDQQSREFQKHLTELEKAFLKKGRDLDRLFGRVHTRRVQKLNFDTEKSFNKALRNVSNQFRRFAGFTERQSRNTARYTFNTHRDTTEKIRRVFNDAARDMGTSVRRLKVTLDKEGNGIVRGFERIASKTGKTFRDTFHDYMKQSVDLSRYGIAAIAGVIVAAAPLLGAALASGIVLAFGAGIAGLGIYAAAQADEVEDRFKDLKRTLGNLFRDMAEPLEGTLIHLAGRIESLAFALEGPLRRAFENLDPILTGFFDSVFDGFESWGPVIDSGVEAFGELLEAVGFKDVIEDLGDSLKGVFDLVAENPEPFAGVVTGLFNMVNRTIDLVGFLADLYVQIGKSQAWSDFKDSLDNATGSLSDLWEKIEPVLDDLGELALAVGGEFLDAFADFADTVSPLVEMLVEIAEESIPGIVSALEDYREGINETKSLNDDSVPTWTRTKEGFEGVGQSLVDLVKSPSWSGLGRLFGNIGGSMLTVINEGFNVWGDAISEMGFWGTVVAGFAMPWKNLGKAISGFWDELVEGAELQTAAISGWWNGLWDKVIEAWETFKGWATGIDEWIYETWVQPFADIYNDLVGNSWVPDTINAIQRLWEDFILWLPRMLGRIVDWFSTKWQETKDDASQWWGQITGSIRTKLGEFDSWARGLWTRFTTWLSGLWTGIKTSASVTWESIKATITLKLQQFDSWARGLWNRFTTWLSGKWTGIKTSASAIWEQIKATIRAKLQQFDSWARGLWTRFTTWLSTKWNNIKTNAATIWESVKTTIVGKLTSFRDNAMRVVNDFSAKVVAAFTRAKNGVAEVWAKLKETAREPINWVITNVYNEGIRKLWNAVATKIGLDKLDTVARIPGATSSQGRSRTTGAAAGHGSGGLARGGVLPGTSTWRQGDDQLVPMRRGEGVAISEAMEIPALRNQLLMWNQVGVKKGKGALRRMAERGSVGRGEPKTQSLWEKQRGQFGFSIGGILETIGTKVSQTWDNIQGGVFDWASKPLNDLKTETGNQFGTGETFKAIPYHGISKLIGGVLDKFKGADSEFDSGDFGGPGSGKVADVLRIARGSIGRYPESGGNNVNAITRWFGMNGAPWCAMFISWLFNRAGASKALGRASRTAWTGDYYSSGMRRVPESARKAGDVAVYGTSHVNMVESKNSRIGGNESNNVRRSGRRGGSIFRPKFAPIATGAAAGHGSGGLARGGLVSTGSVPMGQGSHDVGGLLPDGYTAHNRSGESELVMARRDVARLTAALENGGETYVFEEGAIQIRASDVREFNDIVAFFEKFKRTARANGGQPRFKIRD